ncbi:MAG: hypothetical protein RBU29_08765, partial [bacterium]|nr:hypothetical protein [bacterium]
MKHIPDQAEKLRQLAARETSPDTPDDAALATLDTLAEELAQSSTAPASPATVSSPVPTRSEKEVDPGSAPRQTQPQTETLSASPKAPAPQETPAPRP